MPSNVLKSLPSVSTVVAPLADAVQFHQTDAPPPAPPPPGMDGSPFGPPCLVAPTLLPVVVTIGPESVMALANWSLGGAWADVVTAANKGRQTTPSRRARRCMTVKSSD